MYGNVLLAAQRSGLPKDSVANVSQIVTIDRELLSERVGQLTENDLQLVLAGIDIVLGRVNWLSSADAIFPRCASSSNPSCARRSRP